MAREAVLAAEAGELVVHHLLGLHEGGAVAAAQRGGRPGMPALLPRRVLGHANTPLPRFWARNCFECTLNAL